MGAACSTEPSEKSQALVPYAEESQLAINHAAHAAAGQDDAQAWQGNVSAEYCSFEQLAAAGQVAMCARIYEDTARKLLLDQRAELREPVAKSLTDALTVAGALGSLPGPSEADQLAWAFRRAFDEQLAAGAIPKAGSPPRGATDARSVIAAAIQKGVPLYNGGNPDGCAQVYAEAARNLLDGGSLGSGARATLQRALDSLQQLPNADARAWELRRALDAVAKADSQPSPSESVPPPAMVRDFSAKRGLEVAGFIVNDTVMGGRSDSELVMSDQGAVFRGTVTKRGGGGFASVRFQPRDRGAFLAMLRSATGVALKIQRIQGCASWKLQLNSQQEKQWQQDGP
ncbi:unnamed protein product [Symbiodinium sp. CCMP2592]|nr:unnamed protein product [Symbiodinium sp. CCMP2592]